MGAQQDGVHITSDKSPLRWALRECKEKVTAESCLQNRLAKAEAALREAGTWVGRAKAWHARPGREERHRPGWGESLTQSPSSGSTARGGRGLPLENGALLPRPPFFSLDLPLLPSPTAPFASSLSRLPFLLDSFPFPSFPGFLFSSLSPSLCPPCGVRRITRYGTC